MKTKNMENMDTTEHTEKPDLNTQEQSGETTSPENAEKALADQATKAYKKAQGAKKKKPAKTAATPEKEQPVVVDPLAVALARTSEVEEKLLRLRAEYDNHIKRTNREKADLIQYSSSRAFKPILPILDDLNRTIDHAKSTEEGAKDPMLEGVEMVRDKMANILEKEGVKPFISVGEKFDPQLHDAMMRRESKEHEEGIVLEEFETGYVYNDRVIRHAKVVVSA